MVSPDRSQTRVDLHALVFAGSAEQCHVARQRFVCQLVHAPVLCFPGVRAGRCYVLGIGLEPLTSMRISGRVCLELAWKFRVELGI